MDSFFNLNNLKSCTFKNFILRKEINSQSDLDTAKNEYQTKLNDIIASGVDDSSKITIGRLKKEAKVIMLCMFTAAPDTNVIIQNFKTLPKVGQVNGIRYHNNIVTGNSFSAKTIKIVSY